MLKMIFILAFLISCSKENTNENKHEVPTGPIGTPPVSVPNITPIASGPQSIKINSTFLVDTSGNCDFSVDRFDVIFFDPQLKKGCVKKFKKLGKHVGAYLSAGSAENWRSDWKELSKFCVADYKGWPGECHLGLSKLDQVMSIMKKRMDEYKTQGFQSVYLDNGTMYEDCPGVTIEQNIEYFKQLSEYAHSIGLLIGPNGGELVISKTVGIFDFYMVEDVLKYGGVIKYKDVIGKYAIFNIVYDKCDELPGFTTELMSGLKEAKFKKICSDYKTPVLVTPSVQITPIIKSTPATQPTKKVFLPDGIDEASGMVWSTYHNAFIIHNDGEQGCLFLVSKEGKLLDTVKTKLKFSDFEAISLFEGKLYLGDIGDNAVESKQKRIHVLNEKDFSFIETITIKLKEPFNSEGLAVTSDGLFLSEKTYEGKTSRFFKYAQGQLTELPKLNTSLIGDISVNSKGEMALIHVGAGEILIGGKKLKIKELGQSEAMSWIDDKHISFTSEGEGSELVTIEVK